MEYHFSEHFPSWCTESENLLVTVLSGQVINHLKKNEENTREETNKNGEKSKWKERKAIYKISSRV